MAISIFETPEQALIQEIIDANKGTNNGIATLDSSGKVPASQLPSYVDDIESYATSSVFPATGEDGKIYVAKDTNKSYRWNGSGYTELSTYDVATQSASGLMSAADKTKLDGVATGATANVVSDSLSDTSTTNALSAAKGKALKDEVDSLNSKIANYDNEIFTHTLTGVTDLNNSSLWGRAYVTQDNCSNVPTVSGNWVAGFCLCFGPAQIFLDAMEPYKRWTRTYINNAWTAWKEF